MNHKSRSSLHQSQLKRARQRRHNKENPVKAKPKTSPRKALDDITSLANQHEKRADDNERHFRSERRKNQRLILWKNNAKKDLAVKTQEIQGLHAAAQKFQLSASQAHNNHANIVDNLQEKVSKARNALELLRKTNRALRARADRAPDILKRDT